MQNDIESIFFPRRCPICEAIISRDELICEGCYLRLPRINQPTCFKCGQQLECETDEYCYDCIESGHQYTKGVASLVYNNTTKKMMYRFKYNNRREYKDFFGALLVSDYGQWMLNLELDGIIPIPLYKKRYKERGYNQAALIAREIGRQIEVPVYEHYLVRGVATAPQKSLSDVERKKNLENAFQVIENKVQLKQVLLVDDIYTTGSTMDSVATSLLETGTRKVYCACVCIGQGY